jgi:SAM-dependent methyltransferase
MQAIRQARGDFAKYLRGDGIDIGAGDDPLTIPNGAARAWDVADGDAQLLSSIQSGTFDFVYSSHCLEHMRDVPEALANWTRVLRPNGWLYAVVPDYVFYEKMTWPSQFNGDHKQSFSGIVPRQLVGRPNHWHMDQDLAPAVLAAGLTDLRWELETFGFNFNAGLLDQTRSNAVAQIWLVARKRPE